MHHLDTTPDNSPFGVLFSSALAALLAVFAFHLSLVATSTPLTNPEMETVTRAIDVLDEKGFDSEAFLLRHATSFRSSDHWLNLLTQKERAFAATNFPFQIITIYPDFYTRPVDDTERAMILLHEAQHLLKKDETAAYEYVWRHREQLGWTQLTHGTTATFITIAQQTRENVPELFVCSSNLWSDCTETVAAAR